MKDVVFSPSFLSADFSRAEDELVKIERDGCRYVHLDVMDGDFVPNITFGAQFIKAIRPKSRMIFDVHLMINNPEKHIESFFNAGSDIITIHAEATKHVNNCLQIIKGKNVKCGVSINPGTALSQIEEVLYLADIVLVMSVNPGFGGQKFIESSIDKISRLSQMRQRNGYGFKISVDGGVNLENAHLLKKAGADILVSGSAYFKSDNRKDFVREIERIQ